MARPPWCDDGLYRRRLARQSRHSSAEAASRVAQSLGVPASAIVVLDSPRDTRKEAASVAKLVGQAPLMLVTSANHLPLPANQLAIKSPLQPQEKMLP